MGCFSQMMIGNEEKEYDMQAESEAGFAEYMAELAYYASLDLTIVDNDTSVAKLTTIEVVK